MAEVKTLVVDLETFPTQALVWGLFDQNVSLNQILEPGGIMCWAAKWVDDDYTYFDSLVNNSREHMLANIWTMLDEAEEVVGWNSNSFDLKLLNAAFVEVGLPPPSPYKKIDLMRVVKGNMKFLSNKLDYVSGRLGVGHKLEHKGFELWLDCMKGDAEAWKIMQEYNEQDVLLTERVYQRLRPWISTGVNRSNVSGQFVCPTCGSSHLHSRGFHRTATMVYRKYQCQSCGAWPRERMAEKQEQKTRLVLAR